MRTMDRVLLGAGLLVPFWLFFGVLLTASQFPGYSHMDLAMSQLGAQGAPTHDLSPWVNNLPLGVLFVFCGVGLFKRFRGAWLASVAALLVVLHGLASISAGYFPCDQGCVPAEPSFAQRMHNLSGLVMFLSLTLASTLWIFLARRLLGSVGFGRFSLLCTVVALITVGLMAGAMESGHGFGLYQRLNYGVAVIWLALLAWLSLGQRVVAR